MIQAFKNLSNSLYEDVSCFSTLVKTIRRNINGKKFESEVFILDRFISQGGVCADIGAAYGRYALHMSRLAGPNGKVFCFEPGSYSFRILSRIVRFHRLGNVQTIKNAVSDHAGTMTLVIPLKRKKRIGPSLAHLDSSAEKDDCFKKEEIPVTTLRDYFTQNPITRLDFIKCDIEGAEMQCLRGAESLIDQHKPVVLCEVDREHLKNFSSSPEELMTFFQSKGYRVFILKEGQLQEVSAITMDHNFFFIPEGHKSLETISIT